MATSHRFSSTSVYPRPICSREIARSRFPLPSNPVHNPTATMTQKCHIYLDRFNACFLGVQFCGSPCPLLQIKWGIWPFRGLVQCYYLKNSSDLLRCLHLVDSKYTTAGEKKDNAISRLIKQNTTYIII